MYNKEHFTPEGIQKIINLKASLNKGLTKELLEAFPNVKPAIKPVLNNHKIEPF